MVVCDAKEGSNASVWCAWKASLLGLPIGAVTSTISPNVGPRSAASLPGGFCEGDLTPAKWIRILVLLRLRALSGRLIVQRSDGSRTLAIIGGQVVHMRSSLPRESMERTLVGSGAVTKDQIKWLRERMSDGDDLGQSLMMLGALNAEKMREHENFRICMGVIAGVRESGASWRFEASPHLSAQSVHPDLFSTFEPLSVLLDSSRQRVDINQVLMSLSQDGRGQLLPGPDFDECFRLLDVPAELQSLASTLRESQTFEELFRRMKVPVAPLAQLLWLLDSAGVLKRAGGSEKSACPIEQALLKAWNAPAIELPLQSLVAPTTSRTATKSKSPARKRATGGGRAGSTGMRSSTVSSTSGSERASSRAAAASGGSSGSRLRKAPRTRTNRTRDRTRSRASRPAVLRMVEGDHEHRMGRGPFVFLGVPEDADDETVARAASTLAKRWRQAEQDDSLPDEARTKAGELYAGVSIAKKLISDAEKRESYLIRRDTTGALFITASGLKEGPVPTSRAKAAKEAHARSSRNENGLLERAHICMAKSDFRTAVALLKQAREQDPSSPRVFAALGWATWSEGGANAAEDAEDYLRLALTFDARSIEALTYLVKVYITQSRLDNARPLLRMLVRLDPDSSWAKRTLAELDARSENANGNAS